MATLINPASKVMPYRKVSSTELTPLVPSNILDNYKYNAPPSYQ